MIKAVLLDLDNTLLHNPDVSFASAYLQRLDTFIAQVTGYPQVHRVIRAVLAALISPRAGTQTNLELALTHLAAALNMTPPAAHALFDRFYAEVYPELATCTRPVPGAADLIARLREQDIAVVIATNPIYPEAAIRQRMAWAGLPPAPETYTLVTFSDVMHFAKPDPAYYAEILARVGIEPDEAIMVGDSLKNDILPAQTVGLHTFHINPQEAAPADATGTLVDFSQLIEGASWRTHFVPRALHPTMIAPQYRGNIGALYGMLAHMQPEYWHKRPDPNEWSLLQIVCHLVESERTHQRPRLERILAEPNPFIVAPRPPGPHLPPCGADGQAIAAAFVAERDATLALIAHIQPDDWQRPARHSIFGLTTLLEMAHFTAQHDRLHLNQFCQTLGRCQ